MTRILWIAIFLAIGASQAGAQQPYFSATSPEPLREYVPAEGEAFIGIIVVENEQRIGKVDPEEQVSVTVPGVGDVVFDVTHTPNKPCKDIGLPPCEDEWRVAEVPPGYVVHPSDVLLAEDSFGKFHVFQFTGM